MASPKIKWTKVDDGGLIPKPRHGHRAIAVRELMIVFGGGNEGIIDDLHAYNTFTNQWFSPVVKGDIPRGCAAFGLAADGCRLLFFGGMIEYGHYSNLLYELQISSYFSTGSIASKWEWKKLRPKPPRFAPAPSPRLGHSFTHIGNRFYAFGGLTNDCSYEGDDNPKVPQPPSVKYLNELYVLEFRGNNCYWELPQTYGNPPSPRESHSAVGHTDSLGYPKLLIYGGMSGYRLGDLWVLDINSMTWSQPLVDGPKPLPRSLHSSSIVADKMYVFGGWVPLSTETKTFDREWKCTNTLARLNLNAFMWESFEIECSEICPPPRAGHCAVTVGSRIYIWSGRDGYQREWNTQVCCKDLWYLEVEKPDFGGKIHLIKAGTNMLDINWLEVPFCEKYVLQVMKYPVNNPKKKRKLSECEKVTEDLQPPAQPEIPLPSLGPMVSSPLKVDELSSPQPVFLDDLMPPVPPVTSNPSLLSPTPKPQLTAIPQTGLPISNISSPKPRQIILANDPQISFFDNKGLDKNNGGGVLPKVIKEVGPTKIVNTSIPIATHSSLKGVPPGSTIVKVLNNAPQTQTKFLTVSNSQISSKPVLKDVFHSFHQTNASPQHQGIIINKPVSKTPAQQVVVVSSSPGQRPTQTIQAISRPDNVNKTTPAMVPKQLKVAMGNGITKTLTIQGRTPTNASSQIQMALQNSTSAYKNVKVQVGGKTLTMMMPVSSTLAQSSPSVSNSLSSQQGKLQNIVGSKTFPKMAVVQESCNLQLDKSINRGSHLVSRNQKLDFDVKEAPELVTNRFHPSIRNANEENNDSSLKEGTLKIVAPRSNGTHGADASTSKIVGKPVGTSSNLLLSLQNNLKSTGPMEPKRPKLDVKDIDFPDPPTNIKIAKASDGAMISWSPPLKGEPPTSYCVTLGMKGGKSGNSNKVEFVSVYNDVHTKTKISQEFLDKATITLARPTIIFRVSARNDRGFGPATQVRWLLDSKNDQNPSDNSQPNKT